MNQWLLLSKSGARLHGGNLGYEDTSGSVYHYDDTVPNHSKASIGDSVALWDDRVGLLGASFVEDIRRSVQVPKLRRRCPMCDATKIRERVRARPIFRCDICHSEFDAPDHETIHVDEFRLRYDSGWIPMDGVLDPAVVRSLSSTPSSQHSIRPLRPDVLARALGAAGAPLEARAVSILLDGAFRDQMVRVTPVRGSITRKLIADGGPICIFTGPNDPHALTGVVLRQQGSTSDKDSPQILLRRDLPPLMDLGVITFDPDGLRLEVDAPGVFGAGVAVSARIHAVWMTDAAALLLQQHFDQWN